MIFRSFISLLVLLISYACSYSEMRQDSSIDSKIKIKMQQMTAQIIDGLVLNQPEKILESCSDSLRNMLQGAVEGMLSLYSPKFKDRNYKVLNEFHFKNAVVGKKIIVATGTTGIHDYYFNIMAQNPELFVETGYFDTPDEQNVLTTVWGKYGNDWKLNYIHIGLLSIGHRNRVEWYLALKEDFEKGYYCDAGLKFMLLGKLMSKNALPFFYVKEKEMREYCEYVYASLSQKIHLPMQITIVPSQPKIIHIKPVIRRDTLCPVISYISQISMTDSHLFKEECDALHTNIGKLFEGIDKNNSKIIYQVFDRIPVDNQTPPHHTFVQEFKH